MSLIRRCVEHATGKASDEVRYFISSLPAKVKRLAAAVRQHWGIESGLHWALDVAFNEDRMRQRDRTGAENLALLNRLAVSLPRQDKTVKAGPQKAAAPKPQVQKAAASTSPPRAGGIPLADTLAVKALVRRLGAGPLHTLIDAFAK